MNLAEVKKAVGAFVAQAVSFALVSLHLGIDPSLVLAADSLITTFIVFKLRNALSL